MKTFSVILLFLLTISISAQSNKIDNPSEYIPAENVGGKLELKRFLQQELFYPKKSLYKKVEGTVELAFIIDVETGNTSGLHLRNHISPDIDEEAIRLYSMLQFEKPKYRGGKATVYSVLKIKFSIKNYKRIVKSRGYTDSRFNVPEQDTSMVIHHESQLKVRPKIIFDKETNNISQFIRKNLKYPQNTLKLNLKGTVKLRFVVEPTGRITNIKLLNGLGGGATSETERLLKLLSWEPGEKDGVKVRCFKEFEVNYHLSSDDGKEYVPNSNF
ncbi:MAG: energy transducer TonB [Vicingaceae bacterium]|nr:energy transducer TonB [Vicingaceae bacterium]